MTFNILIKGGLSRVLVENPKPSWCKEEEGGGLIRRCISLGTGCSSQVSGKTGLTSKPEAAFTSALYHISMISSAIGISSIIIYTYVIMAVNIEADRMLSSVIPPLSSTIRLRPVKWIRASSNKPAINCSRK